MLLWFSLLVGLTIIYAVSYILLRTSGDGRPPLERLRHPGRGGSQEEYGDEEDGDVPEVPDAPGRRGTEPVGVTRGPHEGRAE
jgi:hypothetical protein